MGSSRIALAYQGTGNEIHRFFETSTGSSNSASSDPTTMTFINSNDQTLMVSFISISGVPRFYSRK